MDRVGAVRERLNEALTLAQRADEAGPPCSGCRFRTLLGNCSNPAYAEQSFEPATGVYEEAFFTPVRAARAEDGLCGPEALLFEPKHVFAVVAQGAGQTARAVWLGATAVIFGLGVLAMLFGH